MRYFVGCAPQRFHPDSGAAAIQHASYSLENLKACPNLPARPCAVSAPPSFHTGSLVTMRVDLASTPGSVKWHVDTTGVSHKVNVERGVYELHAFVSLYNRDAAFHLVDHHYDDGLHEPAARAHGFGGNVCHSTAGARDDQPARTPLCVTR
jgi:hypothetical protein